MTSELDIPDPSEYDSIWLAIVVFLSNAIRREEKPGNP